MKTVERGAALLDEKVPGWEDRIDLEELDLGSCRECILGQVFRVNQYPAFRRGLRILGIDDGFGGGLYGFDSYGAGRWPNLTAAWRRLILKRRAQA